MVVGYSLGNRSDKEDDIKVLGESDPNVVLYSKALPVVLSKICRNECSHCSFRKKKEGLTVPYTTIKLSKKFRKLGTREAFFVAGERPDKYSHVRALLDLWGFESYLDYVYTVSELAFLEGLIPVIDIGFLTPVEMKKMTEICAAIKVMIDVVETGRFGKFSEPQKRKLDLKYKTLEWAGKLKFPTVTGLLVGVGEDKAYRKDALQSIASIHKQYGTVHEVLIQNFVPDAGLSFANTSPPTKKVMLDTVGMALEILPKNVPVVIPLDMNPDIEDFIKAGVRDLGRIMQDGKGLYLNKNMVDFEDIQNRIEAMGFSLQQRFPLRKEFIKNEMYSKKLGQVFDSYKYKIKKDEQERLKEAKMNSNVD
jgi:7,8-didemethyl-8-hydroxy-5-deazariboflavin synthase CofG subunit